MKIKIPKEFATLMHDIGKWKLNIVPRNWRDAPEWKVWVSGYNAAVKEVNARTLNAYYIPIPLNDKERVE